MQKFSVEQFNLHTTLASGQVFCWKQIRGGYELLTSNGLIRVRNYNGVLLVAGADTTASKFFRVDDDYQKIVGALKNDELVGAAVAEHNGLRLLKQDPWDSLLSFVLSSCSNIPRITANLHSLAANFGAKIDVDGDKIKLLPKPEQIKPGKKLESCKLGYREKYVSAMPGIIDKTFFKNLKRKNYFEAKDKLCELPGVADKVSDCVLLFGLGFNESFPIDVWIKRVLQQKYFGGKNMSYWKLSKLVRNQYGDNAGYAQQFLYHYLRARKIKFIV